MRKLTITLATVALLGLPACGGHSASACDTLRADLQKQESKLDSMPSDTNDQIAAYNRQVAVANAARDKAEAASCDTSDI